MDDTEVQWHWVVSLLSCKVRWLVGWPINLLFDWKRRKKRKDSKARSSFRWFKIGRFITNVCPSNGFFERILRRLWYKLYGNRKKSCVRFFGTSCDLIVNIPCNPMTLVHSILYRRCTRRIICVSILLLFEPIVPQNDTHDFFLLLYNLYHSLRKIRSKKPVDRQTFVINRPILNHLKLDRAYIPLSWCLLNSKIAHVHLTVWLFSTDLQRVHVLTGLKFLSVTRPT